MELRKKNGMGYETTKDKSRKATQTRIRQGTPAAKKNGYATNSIRDPADKNKGGGTPRRRGRQAKPQHKNIDQHRLSPTPATFSLAANDSAKCILYGFKQGRFPKRSISPRRNKRLASPPQTSKSFRTCLRADMTRCA